MGLADGIWWLSAARARHSSKAPRQGIWQTAYPGALPKALLQQEVPAPRKLQRRLLIFILQVCWVFTHIRLLFLGNLLPPALFPTHREWHKPSAERTLPPGQPDPQAQWSSWPARLCWCTPTQTCTSICCWWFLQIKRMVMEMKNGIDDFLVDTLCYPSWALLSKIQMILIISGAQAKC